MANQDASNNPKHPIWNRPELSDDDLKTILSNPNNIKFPEYAAELLESTRDLDEVKKYVDLEDLAEGFGFVKQNFSPGASARPFHRYWKDVVGKVQKKLGMEENESDKPDTDKRPIGAVRLGNRLRRLREDQDLTQSEVAERLGWSPPTISDLERGKTNVTWQRLKKYLKALGLGADIVTRKSRDLLESIEVDIDKALQGKGYEDSLRRLVFMGLSNFAGNLVSRKPEASKEIIYRAMDQFSGTFEGNIDPDVAEFFLGAGIQEELRKHKIEMHLLEEVIQNVIEELVDQHVE